VLPLSHDEVVHGKGSLIGKMPGDEWQKFANLRLLYSATCMPSPARSLLFMGCEFGQVREWAHDSSLEWHVLQYPVHSGVQEWVEQLNRFTAAEPAMHVLDANAAGFEWVDCNDNLTSTISLLRKSESPKDTVLIVCNFTPIPRIGYRSACRGAATGANCSTATPGIRRHRHRQSRRSSRRRKPARPSLFAEAHPATAGRAVSEGWIAPPSADARVQAHARLRSDASRCGFLPATFFAKSPRTP
jgi:1,4-alpha-glucan branching enzyme